MAQDQPGARDVHVDKLLTNMSVAYKNDEYIAEKVFPIVMVEKQSDLIATYNKGDWLRSVMQPYAPGTKGARSGYTVDTSKTYFCQGWKLGKELPDDVVENADAPFNMFADATAWLREQAQLRWELQFTSTFFKTGVWTGGDKDGGTDFVKWSNYAGSNPITDLRTYSDLVRQKTGRKLNKWTFAKKVWDVIVDHPLIVDRLKYTSKDSITPEMLARLVGYEETLIGSAIYVSSLESAATDTVAEVWGNHALGLFVPPRASLMTPAAGYTFVWRPITNTPFYFRRFRVDEEEKAVLEIKSFFDMQSVDLDSGVFLETCI